MAITLNNPGLRTLSVGIFSFVGENSSDYTGMTAASCISIIPIMLVFIFLQKYFVDGIAGAVKG
ncbi:hypothetical protein ABE504_08935 [Paenibacillus oryzisoli]|uniref:hypothetical protein n=1 Tax=Paenibacillus oryzisoli TaxID=1850517 RepID=UPI003D2C6621